MDTHDTSSTPATETPPPLQRRRWPRRVAIGVVATGVLIGALVWYGGRETTLQTLAQKVADASGGKLTLSGVSGSLYGAMHITHAVWRTPEQVVIADKIDISWSPAQLVSSGLEISKLYAASVRVETLKESPPSPMPASLAPPFRISVDDARVTRLSMVNQGASTEIGNLRLRLHGDQQQWQLRDAAATTPWGQVAAHGAIGATRPFKLDAAASLTQLQVRAGARAAQLQLRAGGDLETTVLDATGQAGRATGSAHFTMAPYAAIPLRTLRIDGRNIDPGFFNPSLPSADLTFAVAVQLDANRHVAGSVDISNDGPAGTLDQQRLPLRTMRGKLGGNLAALRLADVLVDFGAAGKFTGNGSVQRGADEKGLGSADFTLHTDRFDLKGVYSTIKATRIAGEIRVANAGDTQTLEANLIDSGMRLDAAATLADNVLDVRQARLAAGSSSVRLTGRASLGGNRDFKANASAVHFNPASFGDFPQADINAELNAAGALAPAWKVAADFALGKSRLLDQPLSGKGKLTADATHISGVDAVLALGQNTVDLRGNFGAPGEKLQWRVDGRQLTAARSDLYGAVNANGVITGTMAAPRTTFALDARGLGWTLAGRKGNNSEVHASGEAWLSGAEAKRRVEVKASGSALRFNPAAFGSPLPGSINGNFDASGHLGDNPGGSLNLALQPSTLVNSPLWGYAKLAADKQQVSNADIDLHVGPNVLAAKGSFGRARDVLNWRIDAPQLAALGPDFGGALRGSGTLAGTMQTPSLAAILDGQNLKLLGTHSIRLLHASANLGSGRGAADPLVSDLQLTDYVSGDTRIATARLQTNGTRAAHTLKLAARSDEFDAAAEVAGGWNANAWNGNVNVLQNRGRYAFTLQNPVPLRLATAAGAGVGGLARPEQITLGNTVLRLPSGSINLQSLAKNGPRWTSKGTAAGVPLDYLAQISPAVRENLRGDLSIGARWALDLQTASATRAAPALNGMLHVFRERGDLIVGADVPVVLGLRQLEARADVAGGALRVQVEVDGMRAGHARVDATAQMLQGRLGNDSPLRLSASADMGSIAWLAPLAGQPGLDLDGTLKLALSGAGTIGAPTLDGNINGDNLAVRWPEQGVRLRSGQLRALLAGDSLQLQRLSFNGNQGTAVMDGSVRFANGEASAQLRLVADKLEALSRPDRTVVVSGQATLTRDPRRFALEGRLRADRALIELAPQGRPTMSDDVIVLGKAGSVGTPVKKEPTLPLTVDLAADLGDEFRLRGMGIDANLAGTLRVRRVDSRAPRINGSIRVLNGTYAAYGQKLSIERGVLTFSGPYDNPSLSVLALRKRPEGEQLSETNVEAGVEVRGTALAPSAKLVSTPTVPDSEKLAWLVLGHGMEGTAGAEADVLSAAAGALLGGKGGGGGITSKLANSLGVDELGLGQAQGSQAKGLESTVVTVGKRISSRTYLSFEQGTSTASSLVRLRYKLNTRITLQFQTGTNNALDVLYSWAFD